MLYRIENLHLLVTRIVTMVIASVLLILIVVFSYRSLPAIQDPPAERYPKFVFSEEKIKQSILNPDIQAPPPIQISEPVNNHIDRAASSIMSFLATVAPDSPQAVSQTVRVKAELMQSLKKLTKKYNDETLSIIYAKYLAYTLERTFNDKKIIELAKKDGGDSVLNGAIRSYTEQFEAQLSETDEGNATRHREYLANKGIAIESSYIAGSAFVAFVILGFLGTFIKIEQRLRTLNRRMLYLSNSKHPQD